MTRMHLAQVLKHLKTLAENEEQANLRRLYFERGKVLGQWISSGSGTIDERLQINNF